MTVFVLQRKCGDYYCGCGGGHILGVFSERPEVEDAWRDKVTELEVDELRWVPERLAYGEGAWT